MADDDEEQKYVHSLLGEGSKLPLKGGGGGRTWSFTRQVSKSERLTHPPSLRFLRRPSLSHARICGQNEHRSTCNPLTAPCTMTQVYLIVIFFVGSARALAVLDYAAHHTAQQNEPKNIQNAYTQPELCPFSHQIS